MPVKKPFYQEVEDMVMQYLANAGVKCAPVPIERVAEMQGATVLPYDLGDEVSGVLMYEQGRGIIGFNKLHPKVRQRFTIAHELAHLVRHVTEEKQLFVDKDYIVKMRSDYTYSAREMKQEREANAFAAAILMPKSFILDEVRKEKYASIPEHKVIEELAKVFNVSVQAMTFRFSDLSSQLLHSY